MIKNIIQTIFNKGFVAIVNLFILIISSKLLGVSTQGQKAIFLLNIANIQIINEIFTGFSLVYFIPKFNLKKLFSYGIAWTIGAVSISNIIMFFIGEEIEGFEMDLYLLSALIILNTFNLVIILAKENIRLFNTLSMLQPFLLLCGIAFYTLVLHDYTFKAYVVPLYVSFGITYVISSIKVFGYLSQPDTKTEFSLSSIFKNGFFCQLAVLMHQLSNRLSYLLISSISLVGLYSVASSLMESVWIIANGITPVILSKISNTGNTPFNKSITLTLAKAAFILSCLAAVVLYFLPNELFIFLLGENFGSTKGVMLWIAPGILIVSFSTVLSHYFSALGNLKFIAICNFAGFICTAILAPVLISKYQLKGAAITANLSYLVAASVMFVGFLISTKTKLSALLNFKLDISNIKQAFSA